MKYFSIKCPACSHENSIQLNKQQSTILLNCPGCHALLLHHYSRTVLVTPIKPGQKGASSMKYASLFTVLERLYKNRTARTIKAFSPVLIEGQTHKNKSSMAKISKHNTRILPISADDILNLIIDLNTTHTVDDFLGRQNL